jgi:hypothetical protein
MIEPMDLIWTLNPYHGTSKPENLVSNANLQEFAQQVSYIGGLEANGQISPEEVITQIEVWFEALERPQQ